ncbi:GNAT family N-acetyltransferase [Hyphomonas adhaerens]|jgi:putative acetyltransferase|uniref:GNAT family N-acetyltransferase n=1 Tax=Hyphomonas adhaerens TaxID=81029 RepID=UPI0023565E8D|nr:GNAT family N-acetyltransferase [Hyphomonas adhaerens]|tara:strand:- start:716 stop:1174 length:459 start_codon:yes stop_codon:yes gene_type:complete
MIIQPGDFDDPQVRELLRQHLQGMAETSPPGHSFALDLSGLQRPDVTFLSVWDGDTLLAIGAMKELAADHGELKSMRTRKDSLRRGAATAMLEALLNLARQRGYRRVSLETGSGEAFDPALALYRKHGFKSGDAFADYIGSDFNQFLHLDLA